MELMNGGNTNTPNAANKTKGVTEIAQTYTDNNENDRGRHESEEYYRLCETRSQNYGMILHFVFVFSVSIIGEKQQHTNANAIRVILCSAETKSSSLCCGFFVHKSIMWLILIMYYIYLC